MNQKSASFTSKQEKFGVQLDWESPWAFLKTPRELVLLWSREKLLSFSSSSSLRLLVDDIWRH